MRGEERGGGKRGERKKREKKEENKKKEAFSLYALLMAGRTRKPRFLDSGGNTGAAESQLHRKCFSSFERK